MKIDMTGYGSVPEYGGGECPDCPKCGDTMEYSFSFLNFKCPSCGEIMDEGDWVDQLDMDFDDPDNPPPGCAACGGPWPHCKTSCSMFDD